MTAQDMRFSINTAAAVFGKPYRTFLPGYGVPTSGSMESDDDDEDADDVPPVQDWQTVQQSAIPAPPSGGASTTRPAPAVHADPLESLFQPAARPSQPAPAIPAAVSNSIDDIFGPSPSIPQNSLGTTTAAKSLPPIVLDASQTNGLIIRGQLETSPTPMLRLHLTNTTSSPVGDAVLQVNTNSFGFVPAVSIADCMGSAATVMPGAQGVAVDLPLRVSDNHFVPSRHVIEVGIKTSLGLHRFTLIPALQDFLVTPPAMERTAFAQQWKLLDESCEGKMLLGGVANAMALMQADEIGAKLTGAKFLIVASKSLDGQDAFYGVFKTHLGLPSMFEIVLHRQNRSLSYVCCKSARVNDVLPVAHHILTILFPAAASVAADNFFF